MKKAAILITVVCVLGFVLVGCAEGYYNPKSKELVIVNASDSDIIGITLSGYIEDVDFRGASPTIIISPGAKKSYYLLPYADSALLNIYSELIESKCSIPFTYDYKVDGRNETITATYTEIYVPVDDYYEGNIELEGSNATKADMI
ncbi:MAG: hypothetical protein VB025_09060 [Sphaerochaeta sp.]|nr:hypothetical protein [Sphaerochaeta sp.]